MPAPKQKRESAECRAFSGLHPIKVGSWMPRSPSPELQSPRQGINVSIAAQPSIGLGHRPHIERQSNGPRKVLVRPREKAGGRPFRERPPCPPPYGNGGSFLYAATGRCTPLRATDVAVVTARIVRLLRPLLPLPRSPPIGSLGRFGLLLLALRFF
jgi:hypothetical protein